jgi:hypothetical protein
MNFGRITKLFKQNQNNFSYMQIVNIRQKNSYMQNIVHVLI